MNINGLQIVSGLALMLAAGACLICWYLTRQMHWIRRRAQEMVSLVERDLRLNTLTL